MKIIAVRPSTPRLVRYPARLRLQAYARRPNHRTPLLGKVYETPGRHIAVLSVPLLARHRRLSWAPSRHYDSAPLPLFLAYLAPLRRQRRELEATYKGLHWF